MCGVFFRAAHGSSARCDNHRVVNPDSLQQVQPAPTAEQAAAIAAAIDLFVAETTPVAVAAEPQSVGWLRAALHEGVGSNDETALW